MRILLFALPLNAAPVSSNAHSHDGAGFELPVAVAVANATRRVSESPENPDHWGHLGKLLHAHEELDRAVSAYDKAFALQPDNLTWRYLSATALQSLEPSQAIERFQECIQQGFDRPFVRLRLARELERAGELDAAKMYYTSVLESDSRSVHALIGLSRLNLRANQWDSAVARLESAREIAPSHGPIYPLLVQIYRKLNRKDGSRIAEILTYTYTQAIPIPDPILSGVESLGISSNALSKRGLSFASQGRMQEAEEIFRLVLELRKGQVRDAINLGVALARQGRLDEAIDVFTEARRDAPDHARLLTNLGQALAENGSLPEAKAALERALRLDPHQPEALYNMANLHLQERRLEAAIPLLSQALDTNPGMLQARYNLASAFAAIGKLDNAIQQWELLAKLRPSDGNVLFLLGSAYVQTQQYDEAMDRFSKGRDAHPKDERFQRALDALSPGNNPVSD